MMDGFRTPVCFGFLFWDTSFDGMFVLPVSV